MIKLMFLSLTVFTSFAMASGSFGVRGGGNTCVEQFISLGKIVHSSVKSIDYNADLFLQKLNSAEIVEVQSEMVDFEGNQYIAMNEPAANRIYLSQKWCRESKLGLDENKSALIAFHEVLGLSENGRDKNYELSSQLYTDTNLNEEDFYYLALTGGRDRHLFKSETYTWGRLDQSYTRRVSLFREGNSKADNNMSLVDCGPLKNNAIPAVLVTLGLNGPYSFLNKNMCDNLLEFLDYRGYQDVKVTFLVGTTSHMVYDVISE
ncbi:hypothetical protein CIK05_04200 [Bdellovibrio sp. qaytius]|nr:hypothetical protein CIK05_04200 [Bdellovibrio sp. qaytius]